MWPPWVKLHRRKSFMSAAGDHGVVLNGSASVLPRTPSFSLRTLKDVQSLVLDDSDDPFCTAVSSASEPSSPSVRRVFNRVRVASAALRALRSPAPSFPSDRRIVVYYTSLRVVRRTFEDCRTVRSILRGFRVTVDERDLSMDSGFLTELKGILGRRRQHISLPQVFIGGRYIGGAEEIRRLHESGELKRLIEGVATAAPGSAPGACERCGGVRFLLCGVCSGSRKRYTEKGGGGFRSCNECNEYGLVRCPDCLRPLI